MTKNEIVSALCGKGYYKDQASEVINDVFQIIRDTMARGEPVQIRGFGTFGVKLHKGRNSLNISTGEKRVFEDCMVPMFRASEGLKDAVRNGVPAGK